MNKYSLINYSEQNIQQTLTKQKRRMQLTKIITQKFISRKEVL